VNVAQVTPPFFAFMHSTEAPSFRMAILGHSIFRERALIYCGAAQMARQKIGSSSVPGKRAAKSEKPLRESQINFSEIPEFSDKKLNGLKRVGRPISVKPRNNQ
jgi:hypothetical protein